MAARRVVVVGAGVIGAAISARLAEGGVTVTTVEAERPGAGTSGSSFAWLNANHKTPRSYHELNVRGMRAHRDLATRAGAAPWFHPTGNLEWVQSVEGAVELRARVDRLRDWGYPVQVISRRQAAELEPGIDLPAGVDQLAYFPEEGYVDGRLLVEVLLARAVAIGAAVITADPVAELIVRSGRAAGVVLRSGQQIDADVVVLCAGWRTVDLAASVDVTVPLVSPHEPDSRALCLLAETATVDPRIRRVVHAPDVILRPAQRGGVLLEAPGPQDGLSLDGEYPPEHARTLLTAARRVVPGLAATRIGETRLCVRPLPVDGHPIIGETPDLPGCYIAVTHSAITLAPYLAVLMAGEIMAGEPALALTAYRLDRFAA